MEAEQSIHCDDSARTQDSEPGRERTDGELTDLDIAAQTYRNASKPAREVHTYSQNLGRTVIFPKRQTGQGKEE